VRPFGDPRLILHFGRHPFLKPRFALKGGTALNLVWFDVPRLSVDIDINYIGAADRETMINERPTVERAIQAVCSREDLTVARMPSDHAGGKWRLTYAAASGGSGHVELDVNFLLRTPLWPCVESECRAVGSFHGTGGVAEAALPAPGPRPAEPERAARRPPRRHRESTSASR
jgi:predicted nucleotidyltransferase component of viral defense system